MATLPETPPRHDRIIGEICVDWCYFDPGAAQQLFQEQCAGRTRLGFDHDAKFDSRRCGHHTLVVDQSPLEFAVDVFAEEDCDDRGGVDDDQEGSPCSS
jgi:hypothetical protein